MANIIKLDPPKMDFSGYSNFGMVRHLEPKIEPFKLPLDLQPIYVKPPRPMVYLTKEQFDKAVSEVQSMAKQQAEHPDWPIRTHWPISVMSDSISMLDASALPPKQSEIQWLIFELIDGEYKCVTEHQIISSQPKTEE